MTKIDAYNTAIAALNAVTEPTDETEEAIAILMNDIARINKTAIKAKDRRTEKSAAASNELMDKIIAVMDQFNCAMSAKEIAAALDDEAITRNKISYRLGKMTTAGLLTKETVTYTDEDGKSHRVTQYAKVTM